MYIMFDQDKPTVSVDSLGCKLNQAEAQQLERELAAAGYRLVALEDGADIYILNTCTVTHIADRKSRHLLRLARRRNPAARLVVTGCYAERAPYELARLPGVEMVLGNDLKERLIERLGPPERGGAAASPPRPERPAGQSRTRAFVKIQDGCRGGCVYCIVPLVRGAEKSLPAATVLARVQERAAEGCREVVLTGTEVGRYAGGSGLEALLARILVETTIARVRLSSLQPGEVSTGLIGLWRDPRLCPHFHLSLQSGSDAVLRRMNRRYAASDYLEAVKLIRQVVPEAAITTDIIVGFPGETEEEFLETLGMCRRVGFARVHVFPFSPRPGTAAASLYGQVSALVKAARVYQALSLAKELSLAFRQKFVGRTMDVLWEKETGGIWSGLTGNYIKVYMKSQAGLSNRITPVRLDRTWRDGLWGEVV
jgi:threonylcarbamoyladenosine tRNA methylthiotransferase MtaB